MIKQTGVFHMRTDQNFRQSLEVLANDRHLRSSDVIRQLVFEACAKLADKQEQGKKE